MYETGFVIALLLWLFANIMAIAERYSTRAGNMRRFGMKRSLLGDMRPLTLEDVRRPLLFTMLRAGLVSFVGLVLTLTSWVYVGLYLGGIAWAWSKRAGAPQEVREFQWRMRNVNMTLDEMIAFTLKLKGIDPSKADEAKQAIVADLAERGLL